MQRMKCTHAILLVGFLCSVLVSDGGAPKLEPNAIISLEFPDLPETLLTKSSGDKQPARLSAQLPENYSREGKFPLFIFLTGGGGGRGTLGVL